MTESSADQPEPRSAEPLSAVEIVMLIAVLVLMVALFLMVIAAI